MVTKYGPPILSHTHTRRLFREFWRKRRFQVNLWNCLSKLFENKKETAKRIILIGGETNRRRAYEKEATVGDEDSFPFQASNNIQLHKTRNLSSALHETKSTNSKCQRELQRLSLLILCHLAMTKPTRPDGEHWQLSYLCYLITAKIDQC